MLYNNLPKNQKSFDINITGEDTSIVYKGTFTVKCSLTMREKHQLELERTRLTADYRNPSSGLLVIAAALATARVKIVEGPAWWKDSDSGADLRDENVIYAIYDKCVDTEIEWRKELKVAAEAAAEGNVKTESL